MALKVRRMFQEIGDRVFTRRYEYLDQNIGIVIGGAGVTVIDTRATHRMADEIKNDVAKLTTAPIAVVVNTHFHWDHAFGNSRFAGIPIHGHLRCRDVLLSEGAAMRTRVADEIEPEFREEIAAVEVVAPDQVFTTSTTIDIGDRVLHLSYHGRAHTDSDIVVSVDDAEVSFMGDLIEEGAPPSFGDSFPTEWAETIVDIEPRLHQVVVPGHGAVVDRDFVARQRHDLELVAEVAAADPGRGEIPSGPYPVEVMTQVIERQRSLGRYG
jgi:glyoxylase-like metal-dependent hydrolase (beta-lactamase superfamily II)